jgi:hypothetical protein
MLGGCWKEFLHIHIKLSLPNNNTNNKRPYVDAAVRAVAISRQ